jgi:hypothetical protein
MLSTKLFRFVRALHILTAALTVCGLQLYAQPLQRRWLKSGAGGNIMVKFLRTLAVASVTLALSVPIAARGIPDRVEALEGAVQTLQADVKTLQGSNSTLQSQIMGLQGQVSGLQSRVVVLESSNTALQNKVGTIQSQVVGLQNQQMVLDQKVQDLQNQGQVYITRVPLVRGLHAGGFSLTGALDLPAGNYLLQAIVPVINNDFDDQSGECFLSTVDGGGSFGQSFDPGVAGDAVERIRGTGGGLGSRENWYAHIALLDVVRFASPTRVQLYCAGNAWSVHPTIVAVSIGNILSQ